jgi:hypothetical protein
MGLVPSDTQVGDIIGIFLGVPVPFVLRHKERIEGSSETLYIRTKFDLVGECYIHGLMDGEGLKLDKSCDIIIQ